MVINMEVDFRIIGNNIFRYRQERKLSQKKLSELIGKAEATVSRIERGVKPPSINTLLKISDALNVCVDDLLDGVLDCRHNTDLKIIDNKNHLELLNELYNSNINQKIFVLNTIKSYIELLEFKENDEQK